MKLKKHLMNEAPIQTKGWTKQSLEKFGKTIGKMPDEKGFFEVCVNEMKNKDGFNEEKAKGFCAAIKDYQHNSPMWRGANKTKKEVESDTKKHQYK